MRSIALITVVTGVLVAATVQSGATPTGAACTKVAVGGKRVCLTAGARCQAKYAAVYRKHGFTCSKGRLAKAPKKPAIATVTARITLPESAQSVTQGEGAVWVVGLNGDIVRVDPGSNKVTATIPSAPTQEYPPWIAVGDGSLWISNFTDSTVWRVDAATVSRTATIPVPLAPEGIAVTPSGVWVATHHGNPTGSLTRIDPATNTVAARIPVGLAQDCCGPQGVAANSTAVWSTVPNLNAIVRVDPVAGVRAATVTAPPACGTVAATDTAVWAASGCDIGTVARIDPATGKLVETIHVSGVAVDVAVETGAVWVLTQSVDPISGAGALVRIDPATNRVVGTLAVTDPAGVAASGGDVWVGNGHTLLRLRPS